MNDARQISAPAFAAAVRAGRRRFGRRASYRQQPPLRAPIQAARAGIFDRVPAALLWTCLIVLSAAAHLAAVRAASGVDHTERKTRKRENVRIVVVEKPLAAADPTKSPAPPEPPKTVKVARQDRPKAQPREPVTPEPPPQIPSPPEAAPQSAQPPLLVPGMALSSTSATGSFAVPVGNSLEGKPRAGAPRPSSGGGSDPKATGTIVPAYALTEDPVFLDNVSAADVRRFYPEGARKVKLEGIVRTKLTVSADGRVVKVVVTGDPGNGFGEAATKISLLYRFKPARIDGRPVATEIAFTIRFQLDDS